jgi:hypothetical protein
MAVTATLTVQGRVRGLWRIRLAGILAYAFPYPVNRRIADWAIAGIKVQTRAGNADWKDAGLKLHIQPKGRCYGP